uniref:Uncharacterized protein n=1 Tax=Oryza glaberrima TaxID=4538 RepID=A0A679BB10_ORYGL|nr:hypothetical protein [Oryza glaberrima]
MKTKIKKSVAGPKGDYRKRRGDDEDSQDSHDSDRNDRRERKKVETKEKGPSGKCDGGQKEDEDLYSDEEGGKVDIPEFCPESDEMESEEQKECQHLQMIIAPSQKIAFPDVIQQGSFKLQEISPEYTARSVETGHKHSAQKDTARSVETGHKNLAQEDETQDASEDRVTMSVEKSEYGDKKDDFSYERVP